MAAGGAASGWRARSSSYALPEPTLSPVLARWAEARSLVPAGAPTAFRQRTTYTLPGSGQGAVDSQSINGVQLAHIRGPGAITSFSYSTVAAPSVGFQILNGRGGSALSPLVQPSSPAYWLNSSPFSPNTNPQATNPNMKDGFVYPAQETIAAGASYAVYVDYINSIGLPAAVETIGSTAFVAGQSIQFQSAFANGYLTIGAVGTAPANYGVVQAVRYTLFGLFPFEDECYVSLSPTVLDAGFGLVSPRVDISFTYQNLGSG